MQCYYCGWIIHDKEITLDHLKPRFENGQWSPDNIVLSCKPCNQKKSNLSVDEFRMYVWLTGHRRGTARYQYLTIIITKVLARTITHVRFAGERNIGKIFVDK